MTYKTKILGYIITCFDTPPPIIHSMTSLSFSTSASAPEEKKFSFSKIIQPIRKVGQFASKVSDVAGKVAVIASIL